MPELFEEGGGLRQGQVFNVPFSTLSSEVSMGHAVACNRLHHADEPTTMTTTPTVVDGPMAETNAPIAKTCGYHTDGRTTPPTNTT